MFKLRKHQKKVDIYKDEFLEEYYSNQRKMKLVSGRGWYQEWGQEPRELRPGDVVNIPAGVKHWHGAAKDSWFQHLAIEVPGEGGRTEWCEAVDEEQYSVLK